MLEILSAVSCWNLLEVLSVIGEQIARWPAAKWPRIRVSVEPRGPQPRIRRLRIDGQENNEFVLDKFRRVAAPRRRSGQGIIRKLKTRSAAAGGRNLAQV